MKIRFQKSLYVFCLLICISTFCYAGEVTIYSDDILKEKSDLTVKISIDTKELGENIYFLQGQLEYDNTIFEKITEEDITMLNNWHGLVFNSENGKLVIESSGEEQGIQEIMNIKLKTKKNIESDFVDIKLKQIKVIGENKTEKEIENANIQIHVSNKDNNEGNKENENKENLANKILPFTGSNTIVFLIVIITTAITLTLVLIKKKNKR